MAEPPSLTNDQATEWFGKRVPEDWFVEIRALVDRDEILVIGTLDSDTGDEDHAEDSPESADRTDSGDGDIDHIEWFREETREARIAVAKKAEHTFGRKVSWAAARGGTQAAFTHLSVPVMTRLRMPERQILDTLVAAGVARSRSDALGWCVRLVAKHEGEWLDELRDAISAVDRVRAQGPT